MATMRSDRTLVSIAIFKTTNLYAKIGLMHAMESTINFHIMEIM